MNDTYLYPYSSAEARDRNELSLWRESHKANIACRNAIEDTIRQSFDGMHLDKNCITPVLEEYGYKRTAWVLANTLHELKWDGRFGHANKQWAEHACIPKDINHNSDFVVRSHPAVLDGFVTFYRKAVQALNLLARSIALVTVRSRTSPARCWCCRRRRCGSSIGGRKTSSGMLGAVLATSRIPVVEQSLPPASRTAKQPDGTGRISSAYWTKNTYRTGRVKSWRN